MGTANGQKANEFQKPNPSSLADGAPSLLHPQDLLLSFPPAAAPSDVNPLTQEAIFSSSA